MMEKKRTTKAAIYARLAAKNIRMVNEQVKGLIPIIRRKGDVLVGTYVDNGLSGSPFKRPGFRRLLRDAKRGRFTKLYIQDVSRLSRIPIELITAYEWLSRNSVAMVVIKNPEAEITLKRSKQSDKNSRKK
jgi:DNA invertase Pin-like site-specific DNA recombinase